MGNTKICSKCGKELPLSEFYKCKISKDGLQWMCKECKKQYDKQWRADNPEYMKQYFKQWYTDNTEAKKQYFKQWYTTIEGYARIIRWANLQADRMYGRCGKDEDPLPSIEQYIELLQQRDYYDGKQYHWSEMGLDRIDNSKPHTIDNVVPCTTEHNRQRHTKSFEEFCELMQNSI